MRRRLHDHLDGPSPVSSISSQQDGSTNSSWSSYRRPAPSSSGFSVSGCISRGTSSLSRRFGHSASFHLLIFSSSSWPHLRLFLFRTPSMGLQERRYLCASGFHARHFSLRRCGPRRVYRASYSRRRLVRRQHLLSSLSPAVRFHVTSDSPAEPEPVAGDEGERPFLRLVTLLLGVLSLADSTGYHHPLCI